MSSLLSLARYQELVGETFNLNHDDAAPGTLRLGEVIVHAHDRTRINFSLYFEAAPPLLEQGNYLLAHPLLG